MLEQITDWIRYKPEVIGLQNSSYEMNNFVCTDFQPDNLNLDQYVLKYIMDYHSFINRTFTTIIKKEEYQDFLEYSKNPELYKASKKNIIYNMKHLKKLNELFESIEDNQLFKNEHKLKEKLLKDPDFAKGDVFQGILNIIYEEWQKNNISYDRIIDWVYDTYGKLPKFAMYLGNYNYQVGNGGHMQYFDNGYASSNSRGFGHTYDNIDLHDDFEEIFKELKMDEILKNGKKALQIIHSFVLDFDDEIEDCSNCGGNGKEECPECNGSGNQTCPTCNGSGEDNEGGECEECGGSGDIVCVECDGNSEITCGECDGDGQVVVAENVPMSEGWNELDSRWYIIDDELIEQFNEYLKSLTLDDEKIEKIITLANSTQKYNL
jgi:hypothetical protein